MLLTNCQENVDAGGKSEAEDKENGYKGYK